MPDDEQALRNIVQQLEDAWNKGDSVAWTKLFADDADFIHVLGGHFNGAASIEQGHRTIFDTIYKGSTNKFEVEKVRLVGDAAAIVFVFATLKVVQPGLPPLLNARPTLVLQRTGSDWKIVAFQNTMVTPEGVPQITEALAAKHPVKGQPQANKG